MLILRSLTVLTVLLAVAPAYCAIATYSVSGDWTMAVTSYATIDFENFNLTPTYGSGGIRYDNPGYAFSTDCTESLSSGQACFMNTAGLGYTMPTGSGPAPAGHVHFRLIDSSGYLQVNLASGVKAAGLELYTVSLDNKPLTILLTDSSNVTTTYTNVSPGFFGFTSTDSIAMIRLSSSGQSEIYLDSISLSDNAPPSNADTPESTSLSYMGLGAIALWFGSRKQLPSMRRGRPLQS